MNYTKPKVVILGEAGRMINFLIAIKGLFSLVDLIHISVNPAYDLDE
jgi:hypothetical protein